MSEEEDEWVESSADEAKPAGRLPLEALAYVSYVCIDGLVEVDGCEDEALMNEQRGAWVRSRVVCEVATRCSERWRRGEVKL